MLSSLVFSNEKLNLENMAVGLGGVPGNGAVSRTRPGTRGVYTRTHTIYMYTCTSGLLVIIWLKNDKIYTTLSLKHT